MDKEKIKLCVREFLTWILDENGKPKEEFLDHAYEDNQVVERKSVFLYIDYGLDFPNELRTYAGFIGRDDAFYNECSCAGYSADRIEKLLEMLFKGKNKINN